MAAGDSNNARIFSPESQVGKCSQYQDGEATQTLVEKKVTRKTWGGRQRAMLCRRDRRSACVELIRANSMHNCRTEVRAETLEGGGNIVRPASEVQSDMGLAAGSKGNARDNGNFCLFQQVVGEGMRVAGVDNHVFHPGKDKVGTFGFLVVKHMGELIEMREYQVAALLKRPVGRK